MKGLLLGALALGDPAIDSLDVYPAYNFSVPVDHFQNESRYVEDLITLSFSFSFPCLTFMLSLIFAESVRGYPPHTSTLLLGSLDFLLEARKAFDDMIKTNFNVDIRQISCTIISRFCFC